MTTQAKSTAQSDPSNYDVHVTTWATLAQNDDGDPLKMPESSDRTVQFDGVFGGAAIAIEGSLDKASWFALHDPQGVAISKSAAGVSAIVELVLWIRPKVTGGDVTTALNARLLTKKAR